jgi:hypothetical protein
MIETLFFLVVVSYPFVRMYIDYRNEKRANIYQPLFNNYDQAKRDIDEMFRRADEVVKRWRI